MYIRLTCPKYHWLMMEVDANNIRLTETTYLKRGDTVPNASAARDAALAPSRGTPLARMEKPVVLQMTMVSTNTSTTP